MNEKDEVYKFMLIQAYREAQTIYDEYWVKNVWGFGDKMRDYLLEGRRRMPLGRV